MSKLEKMSIGDIIDITNIYLTPRNLTRIWKENTPSSIIQKGIDLLDNMSRLDELWNFLADYGGAIDKTKFLLALISSYQERALEHITTSERKQIEEGTINARKLLSDIDETHIFLDYDKRTIMIESVTVLNTKEVSEGKKRSERNNNRQRLHELKKEILFENVSQAILRADIEHTIIANEPIGAALRKKIEYNSIAIYLEEDDYRRRLQNIDLSELADQIPHSKFLEEIRKTLEEHIEEVDFDKLLLCAARNYIDWAELGAVQNSDLDELRERIEIIARHIKRRNVKIPGEGDKDYTTRDLEQDLKRFVGKNGICNYMTKEECEKIKAELLEGRISLNSITAQMFDALDLKPAQISEILRKRPNNYIFFLRQNILPDSKENILRNIIIANECSQDLLQLLCDKTDITSEEICDLFDKGIISVGALKSAREQVGTIITGEKLFERYQEYKQSASNSQEAEIARIRFEKYALAYRHTELIGKTDEEVEEKGEEFIAQVGEEVEPTDLIQLYGFGVIPLKVAVDWGGEKIIEQLLRNETLKPSDARYLRDKGLLDEKILERLFKDNVNMSYAYQVSLVCTVFDGQTPQEQEIRERLAQYYNIENAINTPSKKGSSQRKTGTRGETNAPREKVKMRDPGAKYNLLAALDKDVRIEEGIVDGHIIFHYPNIGEGTVLIEKLHKITLNRESGLIEIKADNESATYVMSEEEFIKIKTKLIKDKKVDRTELTQRWWVTRNPKHWIQHAGTQAWERALKERFNINQENSRYSPEDLSRIEELIARSIESKMEK